MGCNAKCQENQAKWKADYDAFVARFPDYCVTCQAWGGHGSSYDPSPAGVSLGAGSMPDYDTCPNCIDANLCPRCTSPLTAKDPNEEASDADVDNLQCDSCGWTSKDKGIPEQPECLCWMNDEPTREEVQAFLHAEENKE